MAVKAIAIPGAIAQIAVATLLGMALSPVLGWSLMTVVVWFMSSPPPVPWCYCAHLKNGN